MPCPTGFLSCEMLLLQRIVPEGSFSHLRYSEKLSVTSLLVLRFELAHRHLPQVLVAPAVVKRSN